MRVREREGGKEREKGKERAREGGERGRKIQKEKERKTTAFTILDLPSVLYSIDRFNDSNIVNQIPSFIVMKSLVY